MIDYHGGVLNARFVDQIIQLYDHLAAQGDEGGPEDHVYAEASLGIELPYWCPQKDDSGFTRLERLEMAAEHDVWQVIACRGRRRRFIALSPFAWFTRAGFLFLSGNLQESEGG